MELNELINTDIRWNASCYSTYHFESKFKGESCYLRMNDFPDEPLYTLFYKGESVDIDDSPSGWTIPELKHGKN